MKKIFSVLSFIIICFSASSVFAQVDVPLRADYGLIKTEELLKQGKYTEVLNETTMILQRQKRDADAYTYRGYAYYKIGEKQKALDCFKTALIIRPSHMGANKYLATMFLDSGDVSKALEQLQAMRIICGQAYCSEIDLLQNEINSKKQQ